MPLKFTVTYDAVKMKAWIHSQPLDLPRDDDAVVLTLGAGVMSSRGGNATADKLTMEVAVPGLYGLKVGEVAPTLVNNDKFEPEQVLVMDFNGAVRGSDLANVVKVWVLPKRKAGVKQRPYEAPYAWEAGEVGEDVLRASQEVKLDLVATEKEFEEAQSFKFHALPGQRLFVRVAPGLKSFGGYILGKSDVRVLTVPEFPKLLRFTSEGSLLSLSGDRRVSGRSNPRVVTTIDLGLQHIVEKHIVAYIARNTGSSIRNASAILVDTRDMSVKALIGSADYFDKDIAGQVNGTLARRSPGSTLKPFIYGLGFDQGVLHPQTVLRDVPTAFGPFTPENFDGRFLGPITATEALNRSRNIPAVWIAAQLHEPDLYHFLKAAGIGPMASPEHYGLALVLGGGEVSMQELASLYAMLANGGVLKPLRLSREEAEPEGTRLLSPEASFMVMDILRQHIRPDESAGVQPVGLPIYWKTGTSWAFRDAWTAGVFGPYVLVVWVGNFDGSGNPAFVGVDAAAPLFFEIIDGIRAYRPGLAEPKRAVPSGVKRVEICLASGDLPNQWCPQKGFTWFIPGKSPIRVSTVHRPVVIDDVTGRPACPPYDGKHVHEETYEFWPSELQQVFIDAGIARRKPPPSPACTFAGEPEGTPPLIVSPVRGAAYVLRLSHPENSRIALNASAEADARTLYWFVDDAFVGTSRPGVPLYWQPAAAGQFRVRAVDDHGRGDERMLETRVEQ